VKTRILAGLLLAAGAGFGGDAEFERIVKAIESHYDTQRTHIPFMGMANFVVKVAHPEGASGFKLAVFEDLKSQGGGEWTERDHFMDSLASSRLHPLVRTHSRRDGEATYIFMNPESKRARILIATFQRDEATVIEVKADVDKLLSSLDEPSHAKEIANSPK
jgi:hypothetical protein